MTKALTEVSTQSQSVSAVVSPGESWAAVSRELEQFESGIPIPNRWMDRLVNGSLKEKEVDAMLREFVTPGMRDGLTSQQEQAVSRLVHDIRNAPDPLQAIESEDVLRRMMTLFAFGGVPLEI